MYTIANALPSPRKRSPRRRIVPVHRLLAVGLVVSAVSCNGSDGGPESNLGVASGTITGFGSIIVNEIEFFTDEGTVFDADEDTSEDDLDVGQVVTVEGVFSGPTTATATRIESDELVEGPITALLPDGIEVAGQTVIVEDESLSPNPGRVVEVYGFFDAGGRIHATLIELEEAVFTPGISDIEVEGRVRDLDTAAMRFRLGERLIVDYSAATFDNLPPGGLADGLFVEVTSQQALMEEGDDLVVPAERVEVEPERAEVVREGDRLELEGIITSEPRAEPVNLRFTVGRRAVVATVATEFENGTAEDVAIGQRVEVEGRLNSIGELVAEEIEIRRRSDVRIEAPVQAIGRNALRLLGIDVVVTGRTQIEDKSDADVRPFRFSDIEVGDWLEVRGFEDPGGPVVANSVEREDPDDRVTLRGEARVVSPSTRIQILRVPIDLPPGTDFDDEAGENITREEFFAALAGGGQLVKVQGDLEDDGSITATDAELEN